MKKIIYKKDYSVKRLQKESLFKKVISEIIFSLDFPEDIKNSIFFFTISRTETAPSQGNVLKVYFYSSTDEETISKFYSFLKKKNKEIRFLLGKKVTLRAVPHLHFIFDDSLNKSHKINALLDLLKGSHQEE